MSLHLVFTTVVRGADPSSSGEVVLLDWETRRVLRRWPIGPGQLGALDPNPRGSTRGGRGVVVLKSGTVVVATYHELHLFTRTLEPLGVVSNGLLVGLHEIVPATESSVWVTSTTIDAAVEVDVRDGSVLRSYWPRENEELQAALGISPLDIDKAADNRAKYLDDGYFHHRNHLHLNAVASWHGNLYALFNRRGIIANLDTGQVVVHDRRIRGGHNLSVDGEGRAAVNDTRGRRVLLFDLSTGRCAGVIPLSWSGPLRSLWWRHLPRFALGRSFEKMLRRPASTPRPLFLRGLARHGGSFFIGYSPAGVALYDADGARVVTHFQYSRQVDECVHGLAVLH